jgi:hypothetical protein
MMMTIPETKCTNLETFFKGKCIPCPIGSILKDGNCVTCGDNQYFLENKENYFKSNCNSCPQGLVGGHGVECIPCPGGTIW